MHHHYLGRRNAYFIQILLWQTLLLLLHYYFPIRNVPEKKMREAKYSTQKRVYIKMFCFQFDLVDSPFSVSPNANHSQQRKKYI